MTADKLFGVWFWSDGQVELNVYTVDDSHSLVDVSEPTRDTRLTLRTRKADGKSVVDWFTGSHPEYGDRDESFGLEDAPTEDAFFTRDEVQAKLVAATFTVAWSVAKAELTSRLQRKIVALFDVR